jgi:cytochrome P450
MIAEQLGLERSDGPDIKRWTDAFVDRLGGMMDEEREKETAREVVEFQHVIMKLAEERRKQPREDILSDLVNARVDDERPLDEAELLSIVQQLMVAGNETTTSSLAEGMALLAHNPDELAKVQADPSIIPNMVEEVLRLASASSGIWRIATQDTQLGGETIPKGAMVMLRYHAANRDPAKYEEPDRFIADRKNARKHLAFGKGIHMCVGNMLSRKEMTVTFQQLLPRIADLRLADGFEPAYPPNMMLRGLTKLPLTFEKAR